MSSLGDAAFSNVIPSKIGEHLGIGGALIYSGSKGHTSELIAGVDSGAMRSPASGPGLAGGLDVLKKIISDRRIMTRQCVIAAKKFDRDALPLLVMSAMERVLP